MFCYQQHAAEYVHHVARELFRVQLGERGFLSRSGGVIEQAVNLAESLHGRFNEMDYVILVGDVRADKQRTAFA